MAANTLDRMFLTAAWLESIVYGLNCVLFGACIYILTVRHKQSHRILYASCILHILVSTAHNIITLLQTLEGFTTPAITSIPGGSSLYFIEATAFMVTNVALYIFNVFAQDLLLIWRLYVVWNRNWMLVIASLIVEAAHIGSAIVALAMLAHQPLFSHGVQAFGKASWSLDLFFNTCVTSGIAYRLWRAGREVSDYTGRNVYKSAMFTIIESGALMASCTVVMFALDIAGSPAGLIGVSVSCQVATTTPLLIIARLGLGLTQGDDHSKESSSLPVTFAPPVHINIAEDNRTYPMDSRFTRKAESIKSFCDI